MKLLLLLTSEIESMHSLKFDNHGNNLYWCDRTRNTLEVFSFSKKARTTLLNEFGIGHVPIALALVPDQGLEY